MRRISVGIIGMGFIGKLQLDALLRIPCVHVVAVSSTKAETRELMSTQYRIPRVYADWQEVIDDPEVEAVHVCLPNALHYAVNKAALLKKKHLYAEKPLAQTREDAYELVKLASRAGVASAVNHQYRSNAAVRAIKGALADGALGPVFFIRTHYLQESHCFANDYSQNRVPEDSRARALADIGSHAFDLICFLTDAQVVSVSAQMITHHRQRIDEKTGKTIPINSDDTSLVQFTLSNGTNGVLVASKVAHGHKNDLEINISCREAELSWRQEEPDRYQYKRRAEGNTIIYIGPANASESVRPYVSLPSGHVMGWADALRNNIAQFYNAIQQETYLAAVQPYTTIAEAAHIQSVIDACILSSDRQETVTVGGMI